MNDFVLLVLFIFSLALNYEAYKIEEYSKPAGCKFPFKHNNEVFDVCVKEKGGRSWCFVDDKTKIYCDVNSDDSGNRLLSQGVNITSSLQCFGKELYSTIDGDRETVFTTSCHNQTEEENFTLTIDLGWEQEVVYVNVVAGDGEINLNGSSISINDKMCDNQPQRRTHKGKKLSVLKSTCKDTSRTVKIVLSSKIKSLHEVEVWGVPQSCKNLSPQKSGRIMCKLEEDKKQIEIDTTTVKMSNKATTSPDTVKTHNKATTSPDTIKTHSKATTSPDTIKTPNKATTSPDTVKTHNKATTSPDTIKTHNKATTSPDTVKTHKATTSDTIKTYNRASTSPDTVTVSHTTAKTYDTLADKKVYNNTNTEIPDRKDYPKASIDEERQPFSQGYIGLIVCLGGLVVALLGFGVFKFINRSSAARANQSIRV